ncbi:glutamyl-tRNA reductase [Cohnella sp. CIP 111063]|uniref:glutamyl-tRNA reductase n=1 Tax=unclassified Cohnella TaxID=2636738 RepID=UPI000B8C15BF|nr:MULTISPECIES: glutamyl-tRNA reductase [unclassified Cohnella]OXS58108.1 glutamyl-tRNA reductase [Cohnella sp. CIP 111063]
MHLIVVGLNYRTAPVEIRERFALSDREMPLALQALRQTTSILEGVIVATCNRTEIYAVVDRLQLCGHYIRSFMEQWFSIPRQQFNSHLYMYEDDRAVEHLFRVASGLDSMIIGETQILGQVRDAFLLAQEQRATGTLFNRLFKQAVTLAKRAHSSTSIGENAVSVSYAAVELGKRIFGRFDDKKVMIVGAGKMSELTAQHLHANGAKEVFVVNRTVEKARELAGKFQGTAMELERAIERLADMDIVISSTGADQFVLTRKNVEAAMASRKKRPLFLIDIAVPRDIEPASGDLPNVFLYDIDDLEGIVETNLAKRRQEAEIIEEMIELESEAYRQWYATLGVSPLIRALQEKAAAIHDSTLDSLVRKLPELDERQLKVIRKLTKSIVNQVIHDPILRIKELAAEKRSDEAMKLFMQLFALEEEVARLKAEEKAEEKSRKTSSAPVLDVDKLLTQLAGALQ